MYYSFRVDSKKTAAPAALSGSGVVANRKHVVLQRAAGIAVLVLLSACGSKAPAPEAVVPVIAWQVQSANGAASDGLPGDVHARHEMPLSFRIAGKLVARHVNPGEHVKAGTKLAELDPLDAASALASARAALDSAQSRYAFAAKQLQRDEAQNQQNLISQVQLEQTRDAYASASAAREQARQQLVQARDQLGYTTLLADHDGTVTDLRADVGQVLTAGQAVFGFAWDGEREVQVNLPESRINDVAVGQAAKVSLPALPDYTVAARVREVASAADAQSRTYLVKLALDTPAPAVQLGMTANVGWQSGAMPALRIPATALFHQDEKPAVWVIRAGDSTLELRPVAVSRYLERDVLVGAGLKAGERIVAQGVHVVSAGEKVAPIAPPHPEDAPR